jgi:pimeloyl-ACP methyl ester carboxylesterase
MENILHKGRSVFYRKRGKGPIVVLVHGFAEDGDIWNDIINELTENFHLIIPDLPGSGRSQILSSEETSPSQIVSGGQRPGQQQGDRKSQHPTIEDFAEVIKSILDKEMVDECIMIGHSMGGYISLAFAEKYPDKLNALGLFHSSAFADDEAKIEARLKAIDFIRTYGAHAFLRTSIPNLFSDSFKQNSPDRIAALIDSAENFTAESLIQYYYAMINRPDRIHVLETFSKPILFIIGEDDTAIPLKSSLLQCHIPLISYVHILPQVGHMGMMEKPDTAKLIASFLRHSFPVLK